MANGQGGFDPVTGSPTLPAEYQALQGEQLSKMGLQDTPTGPFGALARMIAAGRGSSMTQDALSQITQMHQDALPSLAKAYGSDDPYGTIASDPNASSYAKWMILNQSPQQVADTKMRLTTAQTGQAQLPLAKARGQAAAGVGTAQPLPTVGGGVQPAAAGAGSAPAGGAPAVNPVDSAVAAMPPPGDARMAYLRGLPPNVQRQLLTRLPRAPARVATLGAPAAAAATPASGVPVAQGGAPIVPAAPGGWSGSAI